MSSSTAQAATTTTNAAASSNRTSSGSGRSNNRGTRVCAGCQQPISASSQYIRVGSSDFHTDHFVCSVCSVSLNGNKKFFSKKGRLYCQKDYEQQFCDTCRQCKQKITSGSVIRACGGMYHPEHFRCATCSVRLEGKYFSRDDNKPYCAKHAHLSVGSADSSATSPHEQGTKNTHVYQTNLLLQRHFQLTILLCPFITIAVLVIDIINLSCSVIIVANDKAITPFGIAIWNSADSFQLWQCAIKQTSCACTDIATRHKHNR